MNMFKNGSKKESTIVIEAMNDFEVCFGLKPRRLIVEDGNTYSYPACENVAFTNQGNLGYSNPRNTKRNVIHSSIRETFIPCIQNLKNDIRPSIAHVINSEICGAAAGYYNS